MYNDKNDTIQHECCRRSTSRSRNIFLNFIYCYITGGEYFLFCGFVSEIITEM